MHRKNFSNMNWVRLCCTTAVALVASVFSSSANAQGEAPRGACCLRNAAGEVVCEMRTAEGCREANGIFRGPNTSCQAPNICEPPRGACCLRNAAGEVICETLTAQRCRDRGGIFRGPNTSCQAPEICRPPQPRGACCLPSTDTQEARCGQRTRQECEQAGGTWNGPGSRCYPTGCDDGCPCDWDENGTLNRDDTKAFIADFQADDADINGDGETNQADINIFMACIRWDRDCTRQTPETSTVKAVNSGN